MGRKKSESPAQRDSSCPASHELPGKGWWHGAEEGSILFRSPMSIGAIIHVGLQIDPESPPKVSERTQHTREPPATITLPQQLLTTLNGLPHNCDHSHRQSPFIHQLTSNEIARAGWHKNRAIISVACYSSHDERAKRFRIPTILPRSAVSVKPPDSTTLPQ
ncbi:hypothetical protein E2C01_063004 [Portunus trituberculatus]|uniref:Uncharacterized protein n=1 Tax=Portunus trituberculatus TaxID=210409 RepID=A0A5B7HJM6_PORTR|nr:hypothetical protein [Portunus trituberculatus]